MKTRLLAGNRVKGEREDQIGACNDYLRLGPGRSIAKLLDRYQQETKTIPPSKRLATLKSWSSKYNWVERAERYDAAQDLKKSAEISRLRNKGLAADYERIRELTWLADELRADLEEGLYADDIKIAATGDTVEVQVFKNAQVNQFRQVLNDIAKEVGGRANMNMDIDLDLLTDHQLDRYIAGEPLINVLLDQAGATTGQGPGPEDSPEPGEFG